MNRQKYKLILAKLSIAGEGYYHSYLPNESYGSILELGIFQHLIVESIPPLKHCSPVALTARHSTGPTWALNVYTGSTSSEAALQNKFIHWNYFFKFYVNFYQMKLFELLIKLENVPVRHGCPFASYGPNTKS